jgi:hypothetical protein
MSAHVDLLKALLAKKNGVSGKGNPSSKKVAVAGVSKKGKGVNNHAPTIVKGAARGV